MTTPTTSLAESIDALSGIAAARGLDVARARDEALRVAAALAESVPGAAADWARVGAPDAADPADVNRAFFDAASRGRRWRAHPTGLLAELAATDRGAAAAYADALTQVAAAACTLGEPSLQAVGNASVAAAAYLAAAGVTRGADGGLVAGDPRSVVLPPDVPLPPGDGLAPTAGPSSTTPASTATEETDTQAAQPEPEPERSVEELLAELDGMIGLERVKKEVHRQVALLTVERMRTEAGLRAPAMSRHLVFVGNPGTGKTTVARLIGAIYRAIGLLDEGQLVEVDRSELVAGYVGQTAMKTAEVCAKAVGGVLFIDEAYTLTGDQFAQEAVGTLVKEMEDHREDLVVIVAGYPEPMVHFVASNPGLASRFTTTIEFDDYTDDELLAILDHIAERSDYELAPEARAHVRGVLEATPRTPAFGNGRFARTIFEHAVGRHAWRLRDATEPTRDELRLLTEDDVRDATAADADAPDPRDDTDGIEPEPAPPGPDDLAPTVAEAPTEQEDR